MAPKGSERRVDPDDGKTYTFAEIDAHYKSKYMKKEIADYWAQVCTRVDAKEKAEAKAKPKAKAKGDSSEKVGDAEGPKGAPEESPEPARGPAPLKRTRSWLVKVAGITLLPCEEALEQMIMEHSTCREANDESGMAELQVKLLHAHPFVTSQLKDIPPGALAPGVTCKSHNFRMDVNKFKKWLKTPDGKPFEEKGKGYDDGCYLTSAVLRLFMPRGFTTFIFKNAAGETKSVFLRGFMKFTGLTATDEDEESGATAELDAFMFHGYTREDASRFAVTTKSNGENGKYAMRRVFGDWYGLAGSKNTGQVWQLGSDIDALYPIPAEGGAAGVGPKIIHRVHSIISSMSEDVRSGFLDAVDSRGLTVMTELNDPNHEHIFPIDELWLDHVAILDGQGYPLPQNEAREVFDRFKLRRVECEIHEGMGEFEKVMEDCRLRTDIEGVVIYLERSDNTAVGLVKVKSDHYVKARRTRETMRGALIVPVQKGSDVDEALQTTANRLRKGMRDLKHVAGCQEQNAEWANFAIAFAEHWAVAWRGGDADARKKLSTEFSERYGSMYMRFWKNWRPGNKPSPALAGGGGASAALAAAGGGSSRKKRY